MLGMKRMLAVLFCALMLMSCTAAQAEMKVVFEDMHYGEDAFNMHMNDEENYLIFEGERYSLNDDRFSFQEAFPIYGGKTRAVYEYEIPQNRFSVENDGTELLLGTATIDIPYKATLYVGEGNRRSGEYTLTGPITLTDVYEEKFCLQRNAEGKPALTDRVYLYSYEVGGETRRFAATVFIQYEGYQARYPVAAPALTAEPEIQPTAMATVEPQPIPTAAAVPSQEDGGQDIPLYTAAVAAIVIAAAAGLLAGKKRGRSGGTMPREEASAGKDASFSEKAEDILEKIRQEGEGVRDERISGMIARLIELCSQIFASVAENPAREAQCRRFMDYYLPTTLKMIHVYRTVTERGVSGEKVDEVRASTERGMKMVLDACQKLLDNLFSGDMMDMTSDVNVLEQMLKRDGFIENELDIRRAMKKDGKSA